MKRFLAILICICMLSGCQLASQEQKESELNDKLVGVFVTFEHLGGEIDIEGWLRDNPGAELSEDVVLNFSEGMEYSEKIPVLLGESEWIVPGYEGLSMAEYWNGEYWTGFTTEGFCDVKTHVTGGDSGDTIDNTATIYVPLDAQVMSYANPVYQREDGEFYVIPAMGLGGAVSTGGMSQSVSEETTRTEDGVEFTCSAKFTVSVKGVSLAEQVTVIQMNEYHQELTRTEFIPGRLPESFTPEKDAAYLIVEELGAGETVRSLIQPGDKCVTVYYRSEHIWCLPDMMEVIWSE